MHRVLDQEVDLVLVQVLLEAALGKGTLEFHIVDETIEIDDPLQAEEPKMTTVANGENGLRGGVLACPYGRVVHGRMPSAILWKCIPRLIPSNHGSNEQRSCCRKHRGSGAHEVRTQQPVYRSRRENDREQRIDHEVPVKGVLFHEYQNVEKV